AVAIPRSRAAASAQQFVIVVSGCDGILVPVQYDDATICIDCRRALIRCVVSKAPLVQAATMRAPAVFAPVMGVGLLLSCSPVL
ncbi:MAG TPA: hypothetical protein VKE98_13185, partial [Gemmataceae bacterium]|nr:hypothetical protein [Gemmataceae bacterium]